MKHATPTTVIARSAIDEAIQLPSPRGRWLAMKQDIDQHHPDRLIRNDNNSQEDTL